MVRRWSAFATVLRRRRLDAQVEPPYCPAAGTSPEPFDYSRCPETTCAEPASSVALDTLPDDVLLQIIVACSDGHLVLPELDAVSGLDCLCKDVLQQLHRLRPIVCVQIRSLTDAQRLPWRIVLSYTGELTAAVVEQATRGHVRSIKVINVSSATETLAPAVAERVVPGLLGPGCSLLALKLEGVKLNGTWAATLGEAVVCSEVLRELQMDSCGLVGEMPMLQLPALQSLFMYRNQLNGSLEPLMGCTSLREVDVSENLLSGSLEPLQGCTALQTLDAYRNELVGGLEPLMGCTSLWGLDLSDNLITGGLEPLMSCKALQVSSIEFAIFSARYICTCTCICCRSSTWLRTRT